MLNNIGIPGLILIAVVVLVLFGRGKVSSLMGEVGKGITAFKKGVREGSEEIEKTTEVERDEAARRQLEREHGPHDVTPQPPLRPAEPIDAAKPAQDRDRV
ncbi:MAG: twin-arginine translocase TatA/TatE family subunit [Paracoccus sp. (in: a-proteobacteria)]|nr:twin-arginine translocase TatA/TatE family subunit [Paracoccus sp. (in: a-proteobacteria)]